MLTSLALDKNITTSTHTYRLRPLVTQLFDRIIPHGFVQLVSVATRICQGQEPSGLDHFWSNYPEKLSEVEAHYRGGSDHKMIFGVRYTRSAISKPRIIRKRSYRNFNADEFIQAVKNISLWDVYTCENVEEAVKIMTSKISSILDIMAPIKSIHVRTKYAPWMSESTKQKLKERNKAQKVAVETKDANDWARYKAIRNSVNTILRNEKRKWQQKKLEDLGNDSSSVWKNVKNWLGWTKGGPPTKLIENGNLCSKPKDLARIMNEFFISKVKKLESELPPSDGDSINLIKNIMSNHQCKFSLGAVHPDQILKIISNLKSSQSCGVDNIDSKVIKLIKHQITPVLTHVVNLSIQHQQFPSQWKKAKVFPLHKKSEPIYPKNYRPVSLLPIFSKILERTIFSQVVEYFEANDLLHPSHHGFRQKHNTSTALIQMIDTWAEAFEDEKVSAVVMLDMSAAFDLVNHDLLVKKLDAYGFDIESRSWISSYLTSRSQQVYIDGAESEFLDVSIGVPQGSILGPLLYVIFTNELPEAVHNHLPQNRALFNTMCKECGTICCYADDSTYTFSAKDPQELTMVIANKYQNIANYMSQNKLVLNSNKTHLLIMASLQKHRKHGNFGVLLDTGAEILEPIDNEKLLSAKISNDFLWNLHIRDDETSMFRNLTSKINALRKVSQFANFKT